MNILPKETQDRKSVMFGSIFIGAIILVLIIMAAVFSDSGNNKPGSNASIPKNNIEQMVNNAPDEPVENLKSVVELLWSNKLAFKEQYGNKVIVFDCKLYNIVEAEDDKSVIIATFNLPPRQTSMYFAGKCQFRNPSDEQKHLLANCRYDMTVRVKGYCFLLDDGTIVMDYAKIVSL